VVDDEEDARMFLATVLADAGATVLEATDGDEAIAVAKKDKPDLITLDLSMPGKDGVEAFVEMRLDTEVRDIPVCVITGHPEFRKVIYYRPASPPEGHMDKPVDPQDLVENLSRILELAAKQT
jgi:CheY-like chemotaxis protein